MQSVKTAFLCALGSMAFAGLTACTHDVDDRGIHGIADDPSASADAVTCGASLQRYPVAGPHNGGWDQNATHFSCSHPSWAPDNTDYYTGAGGANHAGGHLGNDLFAARGTPVVAAGAGRVTHVGNDAIGGRNVVIRDGCGWSHYYAHLDAIDGNIWVGRDVAAGTPVGSLGDTGQARGTNPHLHFSVYPDGVYSQGIDPFPLLAAADHTTCNGGGGSDACQGLDYAGECSGDVVRWCEGGALRSTDCGDRGLGCAWQDDATGYNCLAVAVADPCQGLDYAGECRGDEVRWCENGALRTKDCGNVGMTCAWQDHATGFNCLAAADPSSMTCGDYAAQVGYANAACEWNGNGACFGTGQRTTDCDACCDTATLPNPSTSTCGDFANAVGWASALCEWNGNGACNGQGAPTSDCDFCCSL